MKTIATTLGAILVATGAMAGLAPVQLSLTPDIALINRHDTIHGLSLSLWGENPQAALALGFVNGSTGRSAGLSLSLFLNYTDSYKGLQWAPVNYAASEFLGWQSGLVNYTGGHMGGLQFGVVNYAGRLTGLQIGWVNYAAESRTGAQIGMVNLIPENRWFTGMNNELAPGMILVNWRF